MTLEALTLLFDVGSSAAKSGFFEKAKACLSLILERKILLQRDDQVALILFGSEAEYRFDLQTVSWEMLKFVRTKLEPTDEASNWLDGVVMAADMLRNSSLEKKRIVLFSDFSSAISDSNFRTIVKHLKMMALDVTIIYFQDIIYEDEPAAKKLKTERTMVEKENLLLIRSMLHELVDTMDVTTCEEAWRHLTVYPAPTPKAVPWNCPLNIGDIYINTSAYVKVKPGAKKPACRTRLRLVVDEASESTKQPPPASTPMPTHAPAAVESDLSECRVVQQVDVIKGAHYGESVVPLSEEDRAAMAFKSGPKCLSVLGFTRLAELNRMWVVGAGCHVVVPKKDDEYAPVALSALVQALHETKRGAIARKVYMAERGLNLVLLSPVRHPVEVEGGTTYRECLAVNELTWKEGVKIRPFSPLDTVLMADQVLALDQLIDDMDLMTADRDPLGRPTEAFFVDNLREEKNAFYRHCLVERALFPDAPLPTKLPDYLGSFSWPASVDESIKRVQELFPVKVQTDNKKKWQWPQKLTPDEDVESSPPETVPAPIEHPQPQIKTEDTESVSEVKDLFRQAAFPSVKALASVLKFHVGAGGDAASVALSALEECARQLRAFIEGKEMDLAGRYNEWITDLKKHAPDTGGIYNFIANMAAGPCAPIGDGAAELVKSVESEEDAATLSRGTLELEKSQMLMDIF